MPVEILQARNVRKSYDGVRALKGASFALAAGEVHALMGENGAGKSTLAKILAGVIPADEAEISLDGETIRIASPLEAQRLGISIIFQELDLFPNLTVAENIALANREFPESGLVRFQQLNRFATTFLRQVGLSISPRRRLWSLNIGEIQLVAIARALSMRSRIIIMDEPTSSLFHDSVERLFQLIAQLKAQGVAVVYVSHKMDEIFRICDRVTVMRDGETVGTRGTGQSTSTELISMMVGRQWQAGERQTRVATAEVLVEVRKLTTRSLHEISFQLHRGEVLGVAGLVGAGRSSLGAALVGLDLWSSGELLLRGTPAAPRSVGEAQALGIRLLAEDRKLQGLMMQMSVLENGTLAELKRFAHGGVIAPEEEKRAITPLFQTLALRAPSYNRPVSTLSGGNQQKVLLARCLLADPDVLFLDDPTRGVDVGSKEDIYATIETLAGRGKGVIFVSSELPELLRCAHRILVMREGAIVATLDAATTTHEVILSFATTPAAAAENRAWQN